jgi:hypothetical protein
MNTTTIKCADAFVNSVLTYFMDNNIPDKQAKTTPSCWVYDYWRCNDHNRKNRPNIGMVIVPVDDDAACASNHVKPLIERSPILQKWSRRK